MESLSPEVLFYISVQDWRKLKTLFLRELRYKNTGKYSCKQSTQKYLTFVFPFVETNQYFFKQMMKMEYFPHSRNITSISLRARMTIFPSRPGKHPLQCSRVRIWFCRWPVFSKPWYLAQRSSLKELFKTGLGKRSVILQVSMFDPLFWLFWARIIMSSLNTLHSEWNA